MQIYKIKFAQILFRSNITTIYILYICCYWEYYFVDYLACLSFVSAKNIWPFILFRMPTLQIVFHDILFIVAYLSVLLGKILFSF